MPRAARVRDVEDERRLERRIRGVADPAQDVIRNLLDNFKRPLDKESETVTLRQIVAVVKSASGDGGCSGHDHLYGLLLARMSHCRSRDLQCVQLGLDLERQEHGKAAASVSFIETFPAALIRDMVNVATNAMMRYRYREHDGECIGLCAEVLLYIGCSNAGAPHLARGGGIKAIIAVFLGSTHRDNARYFNAGYHRVCVAMLFCFVANGLTDAVRNNKHATQGLLTILFLQSRTDRHDFVKDVAAATLEIISRDDFDCPLGAFPFHSGRRVFYEMIWE
jgi:hypothetical protein